MIAMSDSHMPKVIVALLESNNKIARTGVHIRQKVVF